MIGKIFWWLVGILSTAFLVIAGLFLFQVIQDVENNTEKKQAEETSKAEARVTASGNITNEELEEFKEKGLNPFGERKDSSDLTDLDYQEYIHGMSHQKVIADEKWGFYEITEDRINWLIEGLSNNKLRHKELYESILYKWRDGDFSTADDDHNAIWHLQGGTIGKATGVLSPEAEQEYLNNN